MGAKRGGLAHGCSGLPKFQTSLESQDSPRPLSPLRHTHTPIPTHIHTRKPFSFYCISIVERKRAKIPPPSCFPHQTEPNSRPNYDGQQTEQQQHHQYQQGDNVTETTPFLPATTGRNSNADEDGGHGQHVSQQARLVKSVLYGVQNFYAFMIMLLFMTYNGWVMLAVAVGAGVGYWFFGSGGSGTRAYKETACH